MGTMVKINSTAGLVNLHILNSHQKQ